MEMPANLTTLRQGHPDARNSFLEEHLPFIRKVVNNFCKKFCEWGRDDELSIALIAFNTAIDTYSPEKQVPFLAYAKVVMENRLRDYFRKEGRFREHTTNLEIYTEDNEWICPGEIKQSMEVFWARTLEEERQEELERFSRILASYGIDFEDLPEISPCHRTTRETLMQGALALVEQPELLAFLQAKKQLPLKELASLTGISRKTLEKGRKYIIALTLILANPGDFVYLRSFINFPDRRRNQNEH